MSTFNFALATLWYERSRFLPAVCAVAFSAVLIALQAGLLLGLFSITSIPVDHTRASLWVGSPNVLNVDVGRPISQTLMSRLAEFPEVGYPEVYVQGFSYWSKPSGGSELCVVIGSRLDDGAMGWIDGLTPDLRQRLTEPGSIVVDETEFERLGISAVGDRAQINGERGRVRIVGTIKGFKSLAGPYVFCSVGTAQSLLRQTSDQTTYLLAKCADDNTAQKVAEKLRNSYTDMSAFSTNEFSFRTRWHWLTKTKAGIAIGYAALLGLLVGAVVTSQTLFAAVMSSMREYGILLALGIPRWRVAWTVLVQSFWVGVMGTLVAWPTVHLLAEGAATMGARVLLPRELLLATGAVTLVMAVLSGFTAIRAIRLIEPVNLLR